ncbi:MAG: hypothetical protein AB8B93_07170 [Pseudomonadales bacterium]
MQVRSVAPSFELNRPEQFPAERLNVGWILARNRAGTRVNVFGSLIRQPASVPGPGALPLLGIGLLGLLGLSRRRCTG